MINILAKYKIYNKDDGLFPNVLRIKIKYKINCQRFYNEFSMSLPNAIKGFLETINDPNRYDLNALENNWDSDIGHWNRTYQACLSIISEQGIDAIIEKLIVDDMIENHQSSLARTQKEDLMKQLITSNKWNTLNFVVDEQNTKL